MPPSCGSCRGYDCTIQTLLVSILSQSEWLFELIVYRQPRYGNLISFLILWALLILAFSSVVKLYDYKQKMILTLILILILTLVDCTASTLGGIQTWAKLWRQSHSANQSSWNLPLIHWETLRCRTGLKTWRLEKCMKSYLRRKVVEEMESRSECQ